FFLPIPRPPRVTLFPYTTLFRSDKLMVMNEAYRYSSSAKPSEARWSELVESGLEAHLPLQNNATAKTICGLLRQCATYQFHDTSDRKSTRLNSSHVSISYAVFCL